MLSELSVHDECNFSAPPLAGGGEARRYIMESKVKVAGHAIHPMLIVFPLGLLATSLIFDIIHWITGNGFFSVVAFWMGGIDAGIGNGISGVTHSPENDIFEGISGPNFFPSNLPLRAGRVSPVRPCENRGSSRQKECAKGNPR